MSSKSFGRVEVKDADRGTVSAVFSTFNVIDRDQDVTLPGAFADGADVVISAYGHKSWEGVLPVGAGRIRTTRTEAVMDGQFFLESTAGRDTWATVKALAERGLGEWSYGFDVVDSEHGQHLGQGVRFLKRLKVHEVSPVLVGAGIDTRTLAAKHAGARGPVASELEDIRRAATRRELRLIRARLTSTLR